MILDRRFKGNLLGFRGDLRASTPIKVLFPSILFVSAPASLRAAIRSSAISNLNIKTPHMPEEDNGYPSRTN